MTALYCLDWLFNKQTEIGDVYFIHVCMPLHVKYPFCVLIIKRFET